MRAQDDDDVPPRGWKIGTLAQSTGVTVRALHHYDQIGLLSPEQRTAAGHRCYTAEDLTRLYRITLLRRLGVPLEEIGRVLDDPRWRLQEAMRRHLHDTSQRIDIAIRLRSRLSGFLTALDHRRNPSSEELFAILEEMTMLDSTPHGTTALLVYDDLEAAQAYLVRVFGLTPGPVQRDEHGTVVHAEVVAGDQRIWLHPSGEDYRSPRALGAVTGMTVLTVDDVDAHHARSVAAGAEIVESPVDQGYGVREYGARDPEGQLWYFHAPLD